jgi:hypothetical protein
MGNTGRNELCLCGSGVKYKKCCLNLKIIPLEELNLLRIDRERGINRIEVATEIRRRQLQTKSYDEYKQVEIPNIFPFNYKGNHDEHYIDDFLLDSYVKGDLTRYPHGAVSAYGNLGAVAIDDISRGEIMGSRVNLRWEDFYLVKIKGT